MWVDNDVPNWFLTLKNFYRSPCSKWLPQYRTNSTLSDFNDISYVGRLWCPKWFLTSKNFNRLPFSKWPPQYCTNSTLFDFNKSKVTFEIGQCWIFAVLWWPFWKWRPVEICWCRESIQDIIIYLHMKFCWNRTMLNLCSIVAAILKMATGWNFSMSGIILFKGNFWFIF
jgi:hypothetical protein